MLGLIAQFGQGQGPVSVPVPQQPPAGYSPSYPWGGGHPMMWWFGANPQAAWFFGILWLVTWVLIIAILVAILRWLWKKGDKAR